MKEVCKTCEYIIISSYGKACTNNERIDDIKLGCENKPTRDNQYCAYYKANKDFRKD